MSHYVLAVVEGQSFLAVQIKKKKNACFPSVFFCVFLTKLANSKVNCFHLLHYTCKDNFKAMYVNNHPTDE